jgi:hypothetical protein
MEIAPGEDSLAKRLWCANRLRVQLREVNRILWSIGIRWSLRPRKKPGRRTLPAERLAGVSAGLPDLSLTLDELPDFDDL